MGVEKPLEEVRTSSACGDQRAWAKAQQAVHQSVELYGITRVLKDHLNHEERLELMEMLWQVIYADGFVHDYEANLVRRVAGLLYIPDKEVGLARKNAFERLDIAPGGA